MIIVIMYIFIMEVFKFCKKKTHQQQSSVTRVEFSFSRLITKKQNIQEKLRYGNDKIVSKKTMRKSYRYAVIVL